MNKNLAFILAVIIALEAIVIGDEYDEFETLERSCYTNWPAEAQCGTGCTGRPRCSYSGSKRCGNIENVCYCDCSGFGKFICRATNLGLRWNNGATYSNGTYRFDGEVGDGKAYDC